MTAATSVTASKRPADRREQILAVAAALFGRHGFDRVSVADIADGVGVTAPALYRHFDSKQAVLVSIVADTVDRLDRIIAEQTATTNPLQGCVHALVTESLDRPAQVITYLRERHRLDGAEARTQTRHEWRYLNTMGALIGDAHPDLPFDELIVRAMGAIGVLRGFAERAPVLPRPGADAFVTNAILDMLSAPPAPTPPPVAARVADGGRWMPEPTQREKVLRSALPLFRARGFGDVGIGEIGYAAGVGASNVRRYVDSKEEILVDLYDRVSAQVEVGIDQAISDATSPQDALRRMLDTYAAVAFAATDLVVVVTQNRGALPAEDRRRLRRRDRRIVDLWRAVVTDTRPDLRPSEVATIALGILPFVNIYPQQHLIALPPSTTVTHLAQAYILGGRAQ